MSRTLKVALIFIGALALLFVLMNLETWIGSDDGGTATKRTTMTRLEKQIIQEWQEAKQWDKGLFDRQVARLNNERSKGNLKKAERKSLLTLVGESAWGEINNVFQTQMAQPRPDKAIVDANKKGLDFLKGFTDNYNNDKPFKDSEHLQESLLMYQEYVRAMAFATKKLEASPQINAQFKWTPFNTTKSKWDEEKDRVLHGRYYYSHFKNIDVVKIRMRDYNDLVDAARTSFQRVLSTNLPSAMSNRLNPLITEANQEIQKGRDIQANKADPNYSTLASTAKESLSAIYDQLDAFYNDAKDAMSRFGNEVGTGGSAYSQISDICTRASGKKLEVQQVIRGF